MSQDVQNRDGIFTDKPDALRNSDTAEESPASPEKILAQTTNRAIGLKLGGAFSVLVALLIGIGFLGLSRMDRINSNLDTVLGRQWATLQLSQEALKYSTRNSRITTQIFLISDRRAIAALLATRAENTRKISDLLTKLTPLCDSAEEMRLLAAVEDARKPYVTSYLQALHLLIDEEKPEAARALMAQETTPDLFKYHDAWAAFLQLQMQQMDEAANQSRASYRHTHAIVLLLTALTVIVAVTIAVVVTLRMNLEMENRVQAEREVRALNSDLEQRVQQRTAELAQSNQQLLREIADRNLPKIGFSYRRQRSKLPQTPFSSLTLPAR